LQNVSNLLRDFAGVSFFVVTMLLAFRINCRMSPRYSQVLDKLSRGSSTALINSSREGLVAVMRLVCENPYQHLLKR